MSRSWQGGSTYRWRQIRATVLQRDRNLCQLHLPGCTTTADCVHHTLGRQITGDDPKFLLSSCNNCNEHIGDPTRAVFDPSSVPQTNWDQRK